MAVVLSSANSLFVAGWVGLTDRPAKRDAGITTMLRRLGAVLYVKTNIPQSLMVRGVQAELTVDVFLTSLRFRCPIRTTTSSGSA